MRDRNERGPQAVAAHMRRILLLAVPLLLAMAPAASARPSASTRIVGGSTVGNPGWVALVRVDLGDGSQGLCGGELIARSWVLTAGHCAVYDNGSAIPASAFRTWVGRSTMSESTDQNAQLVDKVVLNPGYDQNSSQGDLALLHLAAKDTHDPVALGSSPQPQPGTTATVLGWGITNSLLQQTSDNLREVAAPIQDGTGCTQAFGPTYDNATEICAGGTAGQDSCNGDSGGPLAYNATAATATLLGTVDYGSNTCGDGTPAVYQRITSGTGAQFLATNVPTALIAPSTATPARRSTITLTAGAANLPGPTYAWDLDGDGVYGDATGATATLPLGDSPVTVGLRATGSDGDAAARRLEITPLATAVTPTVPGTVKEGRKLVITLATDGPGSGTVTATATGTKINATGSADVPGATQLSLSLPDDSTWTAPRPVTITLDSTGAAGLTSTTLTTTLVDDDRPRLTVSKARRTATNKVATTFRAPGAGTITLRLTRAGTTLTRRTIKARSARSMSATLKARAASLDRAGVKVAASWTSSTRPVAKASGTRRVSG